jgi:hypothetical protein
MLVYNIFYPRSSSMDRAIRLPKAAPEGARAECVNGPATIDYFVGGEWISYAAAKKLGRDW